MTQQIHEILILNGEETSMAFIPPLPKNDPRVIDIKNELIALGQYINSSECWRQYIGTWEIKDGKFYLVNLQKRYKLLGDAPVFANWVTGVLVLPQGEKLDHVDVPYGAEFVYESELHIEIINGVVGQTKTIDNRPMYPHSLNCKNLDLT